MTNAADLEAVIVSCDAQLLHIVTKSLHDSGVEATTFDNANAATDYISTRKVDAVIVDSPPMLHLSDCACEFCLAERCVARDGG